MDAIQCKLLYVTHTWSSPDGSGVYNMCCHRRREVRRRRTCVCGHLEFRGRTRAGDDTQPVYYAHRMTFAAEEYTIAGHCIAEQVHIAANCIFYIYNKRYTCCLGIMFIRVLCNKLP